ncbi:MAG: hypothetical protein IPJ97_19305 [Proteobacteria bacterium]|nr:hypothetical protein [Pseudomonadota bacterium]
MPVLPFVGQWRFATGWYGLLDIRGLAAPQARAIDVALKLGYDVTPNISSLMRLPHLYNGVDNDVYTFHDSTRPYSG